MYLSKVYVTLKPTVNDPQGLTIKGALQTLGFNNVEEVRAGKYIEIKMAAKDMEKARAESQDMCKKLLVNPIIENFRFDIEEIKPA
jgi:phosphoribosylformylglycinamidine synthase PurS subunit